MVVFLLFFRVSVCFHCGSRATVVDHDHIGIISGFDSVSTEDEKSLMVVVAHAYCHHPSSSAPLRMTRVVLLRTCS